MIFTANDGTEYRAVEWLIAEGDSYIESWKGEEFKRFVVLDDCYYLHIQSIIDSEMYVTTMRHDSDIIYLYKVSLNDTSDKELIASKRHAGGGDYFEV